MHLMLYDKKKKEIKKTYISCTHTRIHSKMRRKC